MQTDPRNPVTSRRTALRGMAALAAGAGHVWPALLAAETPPQVELPTLTDKVDPQPGSLHLWHLYEFPFENARVGERINIVARSKAGTNDLALLSPPWVTVSFDRQPPAGGERGATYQAFGFAAEAIKGIDDDGLVGVSGVIEVNRPELSTDEKTAKDLHIFRLSEVRGGPIRLKRSIRQMNDDVPGIVRASEGRLIDLCKRHSLKYDYDPKSLAWSWYAGRLAFTTICTKHPVFSFKPVPYATLSVLFDPAKGTAVELIFMRRTWQDPRD
ncbi:hypothetical protein [Humisphaera borealis]|uniref:Uncharacterized protein n=1 Tax=Humisphaera borealis TaxID=2807512 RepID=A0A7M2X0F7_9BACT|nr:hypothetical protein [Humisphaera borealis]QOV91175.1 hypothetical protein IPV69_07395 [Humisphaera borealis]